MSNIEKEQDAAVKAIFCKGTTKLVFSGMITDVNVSEFPDISSTTNLLLFRR